MKKILFIFALLIIISPAVSSAQLIPFGGRVLYSDRCSCSGNTIIVYVPVRSFMPKLLSCRRPVSTVYSYNLDCSEFLFRPGQQILGTVISPDVCLTGGHCRPHPVQAALGLPWLIKMMGTSR